MRSAEVPSWVAEGSFFFITISCQLRGTNALCRVGAGHAVLAAAAHNHDKCAWHCRLMLLMPDHLHAIIAFPREPTMKTVISRWKHFLAAKEKINWQRDFFDHRLRDYHEEQAKISYILMNPIRRSLCERAEDWPWVIAPMIAHRQGRARRSTRAGVRVERLAPRPPSKVKGFAVPCRFEFRA